jgi:hypothetical protein
MYTDRLNFPDEHEVEGSGLQTNNRSVKTAFVFLKDTLTQFKFMNIPEDYELMFEDEEHFEREEMRVKILQARIQYVQTIFRESSYECPGDLDVVLQSVQQVCDNLKSTQSSQNASILNQCVEDFSHLGNTIEVLLETISPLVPAHRPIDIQTTDAGPGVGTNEEIVRLRMTESFLINDLDMQVRFHYAPRDSKAHKVEQVMSSLNEACGDGRFIDIPSYSALESLGEEKLLKMTSSDFDELKHERTLQIGGMCAKQVASRYQGSRCMGTTINACVPDLSDPTNNFFFDEKFMRKCHDAKSTKALIACPGAAYCLFVQGKYKDIYKKYNNGIEGFRTSGDRRCPYDVQRVPAPIPDYETQKSGGGFHYHKLGSNGAEENQQNREVDDYNPVVQIIHLVDSAGQPEIEYRVQNDETIVYDANQTWQKIEYGLTDLVKNYCGEGFEQVARKDAEQRYFAKLRKAAKQLEKKKIEINTKNLVAIQCGELKLKIRTKQVFPSCPPWNGTYSDNVHQHNMTNTCTIDNSLYIMHVALSDDDELESSFRMSNDPVLNRLYNIHKAFQRGDFFGGEYLWFEQFPELITSNDNIIDSFGGEDDFFFCKLQHQTRTVFTNVCSNLECRNPSIPMTGKIVTYSPAENCGEATSFQDRKSVV